MKYTRKIALLLAIVLCLSVFAMAAEVGKITSTKDFSKEIADSLGTDYISMEQASRLNTVITDKVADVSEAYELKTPVTISAIKSAQDFAGNVYTVIETAPTGYFIYHNESGVFVEYSPLSPSPYANINDETLYYGGPTYYFSIEKNQFVHTITDEKHPISSKNDYAEVSQDVHEKYLSMKDDAVADYVKYGTTEVAAEYRAQAATADKYTYIRKSEQISSLTTQSKMGYIDVPGGACGYIAAGILLLWHKKTINSNFITTVNGQSYTASSGGNYYFVGNPSIPNNGLSFSYNLWRWHSGFGRDDYKNGTFATIANDIHTTVSNYLVSKGISASHLVEWLPASFAIRNFMINHNRPYLLMGNHTYSNGSTSSYVAEHAILVYGYTTSQPYTADLVAHFGWANYSKVFVADLSSLFTCGYVLY